MNFPDTSKAFQECVQKMQEDLERYSSHDAAKDNYINKQNRIIKTMVDFFNSAQSELNYYKIENKKLYMSVLQSVDLVKKQSIILEMAHVVYPHAGLPLREIKFFKECHLEHCDSNLHKQCK